MNNDSLANTLAEFTSRGYVIAPAGYGKTHLIALAVKEAKCKQLILTHTFAGVNSIKNKMTKLGVPSKNYQVDTIASWSLRLSLNYPKTSKWAKESPSKDDWRTLYESCKELLTKNFIKKIICCTYGGIYVDEYQDCSKLQHSIIYELSNNLPCRIIGDPLQAIFDFSDECIQWENDIYGNFEKLGELEIPYRWHNSDAKELGDWLKKVRTSLEKKENIDLSKELPKGVFKKSVNLDDFNDKKRLDLFYKTPNDDSSIIAIYAGDYKSKQKSHRLAKSLSGKFSSIDEIEGKDLFEFLDTYQKEKDPGKLFLLIIEFTKKCFTGVDKILSAGTKKGIISKTTKATKYPDILCAANDFIEYPRSQKIKYFLNLLMNKKETRIHRRDLFNRFLQILTIHIDKKEEITLLESARTYQKKFRHSGRPVRYNKIIGTILLVKGLEYDHAIILDADSLNARELYVAMTRGAKSLTIITNKNIIQYKEKRN